jgi:quinol monooxygenase YgiN
MPITFIFDLPDMTQEQYELAHRELGNPLEQGALVHIAGPMEGGWCVVEVWPSQEAADRFFGSQRVQQAFQKAGMPPIQPIVFSIYALYASPQQA